MSTLSAEVKLPLSPFFALNCAFDAPSGFTVLFGPSGAGKTSLLDCIAGIKTPASGRVSIDGSAMFSSDAGVNLPPASRGLAYVFQTLALFPHLTVKENVSYGVHRQPVAQWEDRCQHILRQFGIGHLNNQRPGDLSGGERQRVALARSLVTDPRALLLDEPLAALDRKTRLKIVDDLHEWNVDHQVPILYVTHSVREALALGERVLLIKDGRIAASGAPSELLDAEDWE